MCLKPIKIHNKSLTIGCSDWTQYELQVPCGQCAECKQLMRDQYYLRAYWQARYTFDRGGWMLFDTLTYDDSHLPHLSDTLPELKNRVIDFPCFSYQHTRRFWIDLRQSLSRAGYSTDFGYFLCSEYGTSDRGTHRPHYHILIYNTDPKLDPVTLSKLISKAWPHGRTDGVPYQSEGYVKLRNVFGKGFNDDNESVMGVTRYVMKYVVKNDDFENRVKNRLNIVMNTMVRDKYELSEDDFVNWFDTGFASEFKPLYRKVKRLVSQFNRQSQHFGEYALSQSDIDEIMETGQMAMPDRDKVVTHIPLPMYYSRKLFCTQVVLDDGRRVWIPTELGKQYRYKRTYQSAALMVRRYNEWLDNIGIAYLPSDEFFLPDGTKFSLTEQECQDACNELRKRFYELMRGRSLLDLAVYQMFYRGRVIPNDQLLAPKKLHPMDVVSSQLSADPRHTQNVYRLRTYIDPLTGEETDFMSLVGDDKFTAAACERLRGRSMAFDVVTVKVFKRHFVVNDTTFPEYEGFDEVIDLYEGSQRVLARRKQEVFDKKERIQQLRKILKNS